MWITITQTSLLTISLYSVALALALALRQRLDEVGAGRGSARDDLDAAATRRELYELDVRLAEVEDRVARWQPAPHDERDPTLDWRNPPGGVRGQRAPRQWRRAVHRRKRKHAHRVS